MRLHDTPFRLWIRNAFDSLRGFQLFSICRQGAAFVVSILLAKSTIGTANIGVFEVWIYLGLVLTFLCFNGSLQAYANSLSWKGRERVDHHLFNIYLLNGLTALVVCAVLCYLIKPISVVGIADVQDLGWVLLYLWLHLTASLTPYILLVKNHRNWFGPYSIFYLLGYVLAVGIPLFFELGLEGILFGLILFAILEHILLVLIVIYHSTFQIDFSFLRYFLKISLPLTIYGGIGLLAQIFDAWLVDWYFDDFKVFAQFRYGARELPGALALAGAFTSSLLVLLGANTKDGLERMLLGSRRLMHAFFPLTWILLLCSPFLFRIFYNFDFQESAWIFNTYLLLMISRWIFPHAILIAKEENRILIAVSIAELALNIGLSIWLVSTLGLVGIALATVVAFGFEKFLLAAYLARKYNLHFGTFIPIRIWSIYSFGTVLFYLLSFLIWK